MAIKKKDNKSNSKKLILSITIPSIAVTLATIIPPTTIAIINATKPNINEYVFTNNEINKNNLTIDLFKPKMLDYFKTYLKASSISISNFNIRCSNRKILR